MVSHFLYTRKCFQKTSIGYYYSKLAIIDTVTVCFSIKFFLKESQIIDLTTFSIVGCKFFATGIYIFPQLSAWILVIISVERLYSIKQSAFLFRLKRKFPHSLIILVVFFVLFILNIPNLVYLEIGERD